MGSWASSSSTSPRWGSRRSPASRTSRPPRARTSGSTKRCSATLDKQPLAQTLEQLQAQVDAFDHIYNTERPHQGLPGRVTPQTAWDATAKAGPPRPKPDPPFLLAAATRRFRPAPAPEDLPDLPAGTTLRKLTSAGSFMMAGVHYMVGGPHGFQPVLVIVDGDKITVADLDGEILIEHTRPAPGITYVGNGRPRGPRPKKPRPSPKS